MDLSYHFDIPSWANFALSALESAGHEAWIVGGWVRDKLRGAPEHDVDICTDAYWAEVERIFFSLGIEVKRTGIQHGTVTVIIEGHGIEITTYRVESGYTDHRHPDCIDFVKDVREDLARRDFTVNAMAYHPKRGLLDLFGGVADIRAKEIRAVGEPARRFEEDALRVMRAVRFACKLGYTIEDKTLEALPSYAIHLRDVSRERVGQELTEIINSGKMSWALLHAHEVLSAAIPEIGPMYQFDQRSPYHRYDVLVHTALVCRATEAFTAGMAGPSLRWAALLHDIAKPMTYTQDENGRGHFYGHPKLGAQKTLEIFSRLALPNQIANECALLIKLHDHSLKASSKSIRRTLLKLETACPGRAVPLMYDLINLKRADAAAKVPSAIGYAVELDRVAQALRAELEAGAVFRVKDLAVSGSDVMEYTGIKPGPWLGVILREVLSAVVNGDIANDRDEILKNLTI